MDLWIRSQDRDKLVLTKGFETQYNNYDGGCQIFAVWQNNYQMIGKYKSKKRALEVLDEIQNILKPIIKIKYEYDDSQPIMNGEWLKSLKEESKIEELSTYVYEMPKK